MVGTAYSPALRVMPEDTFGNSLSGITVTFTGPNDRDTPHADGHVCPRQRQRLRVGAANGVAMATPTANNKSGGPFNVTAVAATQGSTTVSLPSPFQLTQPSGGRRKTSPS